ncbi:hypothetical protein KY334_00210, partial [Candidatus Woesearchaeota archaeon]|nr:hypothetical protein [Candidatus Woesearchaeota archaeon]
MNCKQSLDEILNENKEPSDSNTNNKIKSYNFFKNKFLVGLLGISLGFASLSYESIIKPILRPKLVLKENLEKYPYEVSPFIEYAALEENILENLKIPTDLIKRNTKEIIDFADDYAYNVAKELKKRTRAKDHYEASKLISKEDYMEVLAKVLRENKKTVFYSEESLLSNSFNEDLHPDGGIHLDCDLITYLFLHASYVCDMPQYAICSPSHMFTAIKTSNDNLLIIETTQFRGIDKIYNSNGEVIGYNKVGKKLGEKFFSSFEEQRKKSSINKDFELKNNFYQLINSNEDLVSYMVANILGGITSTVQNKISEQKEKGNDVTNLEDILIRVHSYNQSILESGKKNYLLVNNFYITSLNNADNSIEKKDYSLANKMLNCASWVEKNYDDFLITIEPESKIIRGKLLNIEKKYYESQIVLEEAIDFYKSINEKTSRISKYGCLITRSGKLYA